ncbi:MAG: hypothetical protein SPJ45_00810, partial [Anaerovoracaceae bacterium]|nr:hypothetical protein [Anaerovoracaceae bacterium]
EINTIEDVIYMGRKNDVSCIIDAHMNLFEHQSTYNPNMPLRGFIYIAKLYEKYIEQYELNIYSEKLEKIPTPKYFVLYNGTRDMPERMELKLSDAFMHPDESSGIEFTAIMININYGMNKELMAACSTLEEYAIFIDRVRRYADLSMSAAEMEKAVDRAVNECIKEGVLFDFLTAHKAEVKGMILTDYDEEKTMEMFKREYRQDGYSEGIQDGFREGEQIGYSKGEQIGYSKGEQVGYNKGEQEKEKSLAERFKAKGMSDKEIADLLDITPERLKEILRADSVHEL